MVGGAPQGMDPTVNLRDLCSARSPSTASACSSRASCGTARIQAARHPGKPRRLTRNLLSGFNQLRRGLVPATKYMGGIVYVRDRAGSGRLPYTPVAASEQREALKIVTEGMFPANSFRFKPEFLARLALRRLDTRRGLRGRQRHLGR